MAAARTLLLACLAGAAAAAPPLPDFELVRALDGPVIGRLADASNFGGFEGGLYFKEEGRYFLFPSECLSDVPGKAWDIHMTSHAWSSPDGLSNWTRGPLIFNSSAKTDGSDRRGSIWAPMPIFDEEAGVWQLFYVGYTVRPGKGQVDGAIYRLASTTPGRAGLAGPYPSVTAEIIMDLEGIGGKPGHWEGSAKDQGVDSFYPWRLDNGTWLAFFGGHDKSGDTGGGSTRTWKVGMARAERLAGPWQRLPGLSPAEYIETPEGIENPIVVRSTDRKLFVAVYDALLHPGTVGISVSADGVHFGRAQYVDLRAQGSGCGGVRTPQGLVPEPQRCRGCYSMLYTGMGGSGKERYRNECWVLLRNRAESGPPILVA